jgi:hypothetical protein
MHRLHATAREFNGRFDYEDNNTTKTAAAAKSMLIRLLDAWDGLALLHTLRAAAQMNSGRVEMLRSRGCVWLACTRGVR